MRIRRAIGNKELWEREKTLFLSSRHAPIACYEKVFQWVEDFDKRGCAVCFNTSGLEEEVLKALLVCGVPTTLVVLGKFKDTYNVPIERALESSRLLILVLQPEESDGRGFPARLRNQYVIKQVQHIVCGHINHNGSIFGLLAGLDNVVWLRRQEGFPIAAEQPEKPHRWTVAEDKRLLRMFYEDMGIHAIHKAIGRPYSTVYSRIKSLTMSNETIKGREFEDYAVSLLAIPNREGLILKKWRGDKTLPGIYPENNSAPDLVFEYKDKPFAIECKWRSLMPRDIGKDILPAGRMATFAQYSSKNNIPIFLLLGIGGVPGDPDILLLAPLTKELTAETLCKCNVLPGNLFEAITRPLSKPGHTKQQQARYPNAYAHWGKEDDRRLTDLFRSGTAIPDLMAFFGRSRDGITSRLKKLGLQPSKQSPQLRGQADHQPKHSQS